MIRQSAPEHLAEPPARPLVISSAKPRRNQDALRQAAGPAPVRPGFRPSGRRVPGACCRPQRLNSARHAHHRGCRIGLPGERGSPAPLPICASEPISSTTQRQKTLVQKADSADFAVKQQSTWGMSGKEQICRFLPVEATHSILSTTRLVCLSLTFKCCVSQRNQSMKHLFSIFLVATLLTSPAIAQSGWRSDGNGGLRGTGNNLGSGWRSDGNGGFRGTGDNLGSGWRSNGNGDLRGTGKNLGSGWRSDGMGGSRGTGSNLGSGWRSDGNGGFRGTGENLGKNCRNIGTQLICN